MAFRGHYAAMLGLTAFGIFGTVWIAQVGLALVALHAMWRAKGLLDVH